VDLKVVVDKSQATSRRTVATFLANSGVPVRVDYRHAIMHDKFIVVDDETAEEVSLITPLRLPPKMRRNLVALRGCPEVAGEYAGELLRLGDESETTQKRYQEAYRAQTIMVDFRIAPCPAD
jgi:hypothetical protein